jgi:hypothetical protein
MRSFATNIPVAVVLLRIKKITKKPVIFYCKHIYSLNEILQSTKIKYAIQFGSCLQSNTTQDTQYSRLKFEISTKKNICLA